MQDLLSRLGTLDSKIDLIPLEELACNAGFTCREARKAPPRQWLRAICLLASLPAQSLRTYAWLLGLDKRKRPNYFQIIEDFDLS